MDDKPITPSKKSFSAIVEEEMLNFAQNTCNIAKNKSSGNVRKFKYLKRGEGLKRFYSNAKNFNSSSNSPNENVFHSTIRQNITNVPATLNSNKTEVNSSLKLKPLISHLKLQENVFNVRDEWTKVPFSRPIHKLNLISQASETLSKTLGDCPKWTTVLQQSNKTSSKEASLCEDDHNISQTSKREQESLLAFELLEQHTANSSFCSTSSLVTKLLDTAVKSTPKKEIQNISVHRKSEKRDVSSQCVTNLQDSTKNQLPNHTPSFSELAGNWRYAIKSSSQPLTFNQNNTGTNCDRKNKELEYENKISIQSDLPDRIGLGERIVSALKGLENSISNKPTLNTNLKSGSNDHKQLHVHFAEKEQIFNGNDNSTVTSSTYSEVAEDSPTVNAESKFQDDSEWSDCEWNSDLNSSDSVNEDQQEIHYPVSGLSEGDQHTVMEENNIFKPKTTYSTSSLSSFKNIQNSCLEKHSENSDLKVQKSHNENSNQDFSNQKRLHAHGLQEHDKNILQKTETLRARLQELENEIEIFKKENHTLTKLRKEHEENMQTFLKEKKKYENQMKENEEKLRGTIDEEKRKLAKERMVFEKYCKNIKNQPSKKEREEIQALRQQVAELQEELNKKNSRWSANQVRTTERLKQMGAENSRLKQELETLRKEKEQNNKKMVLRNFGSNKRTKFIHLINEQIDEIKSKQLTGTQNIQNKVKNQMVTSVQLTKQSKPKQVQNKSSEGSFMETIFDNGDIEQKFEDKNLVKYYYASTSTWQTTEADETEIFEFPNGQIERHYKDNSKEVTFPDGSVKLVHSRGQEEWKLPDRTLLTIGALGEKVILLPNGQKEIHTAKYQRREYPDGTVKIVFPDGRQETHYPNGRLRIKDAKGNLILDLIETK